MEKFIFRLPRHYKWGIMVAGDVFIFWSCLFLSFYIRLLPSTPTDILYDYSTLFWVTPFVSVPVFIAFGLYHIVVRYIDHHAILVLGKGCLVACGVVFAAHFFMGNAVAVPRSVPLIYLLLTIVIIVGVRFVIRGFLSGHTLLELCRLVFSRASSVHVQGGKPVVIVGAGKAGQQLLNALKERKGYQPVAFVDDNEQLHNRLVSGVRIYSMQSLPRLLIYRSVEEILLAIPSASRSRKKAIIQTLEHYGLPIKTMPGLADIASGRLKVQEIQDVDIGDLLGREEISPKPELLEKCIKNKTVMVTGAGGSIGSELCRQILHSGARKLILFDVSEYALYQIDQELAVSKDLQQLFVDIIPVLGSVNDPDRLLDIMKGYQVDSVYHAAAYKHVPLVEYNLSQGIRNNVMGTLYTAQAAIIAGVERFVLISTDKAVRPTNVMGASKRLAEMALQALNAEPIFSPYNSDSLEKQLDKQPVKNKTCFSMVRFGNVLGSSGSVIPKFREQIKSGGPVTVTHPEITRYFMTIPEAAQLVLQAGSLGKGGEVFVLEMGEPVKVADLAARMIKLSGLTIKNQEHPDGDIAIRFTGLRPGEKLYEELLIGGVVHRTEHPRIFKASEEMLSWEALCDVLDELLASVKSHNYKKTKDLLLNHVNGYHSSTHIVDWLSPATDKDSSVA